MSTRSVTALEPNIETMSRRSLNYLFNRWFPSW